MHQNVRCTMHLIACMQCHRLQALVFMTFTTRIEHVGDSAKPHPFTIFKRD
jgi:hypothetical protein